MLDVISSFSYYVGVNTMAIQSMKESSERKMVDARNLKEKKSSIESSNKIPLLRHGPLKLWMEELFKKFQNAIFFKISKIPLMG